MWDMVKDEDPVPTYQQVGAWQKMTALCTDQADALQKALDQLMAKWPPNPGSAAEVFKKQVDFLIWSMRDSAAAATATWPAVIEIVLALSQAKDAIGVLVERHNAFEKAEDDGVVPNPPVGWRDALDAQARRIVTAADVQVGQAAAQIKSPVLYPGIYPSIDTEPPHPRPGVSGSSTSRRTVPVPSFDPPIPGLPEAPPTSDPAPVLDGDNFSSGRSGVPNGLIDEPLVIGSFASTPAGTVLAPGGVIGRSFPPSVGGTTAARAGSTETGTASTARGMPGMLAPPMIGRAQPNTGKGGGVASGGRRRRRSDPDDPWTPPAGGPHMLEAAAEPEYFDPGPNVIGIDR
jgi:hypothetical protein